MSNVAQGETSGGYAHLSLTQTFWVRANPYFNTCSLTYNSSTGVLSATQSTCHCYLRQFNTGLNATGSKTVPRTIYCIYLE